MAKRTVRIAFDVALTLMIVFEMFIQYTGDFLHEVIGLAFFLTVIAHLALSAAWMRNTVSVAKQGQLTGRRAILATMGCLLAVTMLVLGASSVAISNVLADAGFTWTLGSYAIWTTIHTISSYALCALVVVHLSMHWAFLAAAFKVPYNPDRRHAIGAGVQAVAAVGAVALGVAAVREVMPASTLLGQGVESAHETDGKDGNGSGNGLPSSVDDLEDSEQSYRKQKGSNGHGKHNRSYSQDETTPDSSSDSESYSGDSHSGNSSSGDTSSATGICTLCRKRCPLSAPLCNRPYEAGLI